MDSSRKRPLDQDSFLGLKLPADAERVKVARVLLLILLVFYIGEIAVDALTGKVALAGVLLIGEVVAAVVALWVVRSAFGEERMAQRLLHFVLLTYATVFVLGTWLENYHPELAFWGVIFPFIFYHLAGARSGTILCVAGLAVFVAGHVIALRFLSASMPTDMFVQSGMCYVYAAILAYKYESIRAGQADELVRDRSQLEALVAQLRRKEEQLRERTDEAERANVAKMRFLAAASHDLRQPIHAQGLFLDLLARSGLAPTQRDLLVKVRATTDASAEMLNTLLDFSRIEAGVIEPQMRPFHLQALLDKIEGEFAPLAMAKDLVFRSRETRATAQSDPALLELVVRNLVSNAIRYTEKGGMLLACRARGDEVWLEVWDTGIGIEPAQQREVFREFHQLGNPERDRRKGLGLGLAIVDGLARTMGHRLVLHSVLGRGSMFRLVLPAARVVIASDAMEPVEGNGHALYARVLVIDDDAAVRAGMAQLLEDWGCECVAVESIEEALAAARAQRPDIVVSDYRLREQRTGAEAIAALRAEFGADLPALLITGDTAPDRLREAHASNVPLLHKPVSPSLLHRRLVELLSLKARAADNDIRVTDGISP